VAESILRPEAVEEAVEEAVAVDSLQMAAAGANPTSDYLLMPPSRQWTLPRNFELSMPASQAHTPL
jgi:hypothetical protein